MTIGIAAIINAVTSHAAELGFFDVVQGHEPKSIPGTGLTYAVFVSMLGPARTGNGLATTSARLELTGRIYKPFMSQPEDLIDINMVDAVDALFASYSGDFDLGANVRCVDLLGSDGPPLAVRAGYQTVDKLVCRVLDITIPVIVNDAWTQVS